MSYSVEITPGRAKEIKPKELDQKNTLENLRHKCDRARVVLVDDIDRLAYKESTQCELMRMIEKDKLVILAGSNRTDNLCLHENVDSSFRILFVN